MFRMDGHSCLYHHKTKYNPSIWNPKTDVDLHEWQLAKYLEWAATVASTTMKQNIMQAYGTTCRCS